MPLTQTTRDRKQLTFQSLTPSLGITTHRIASRLRVRLRRTRRSVGNGAGLLAGVLSRVLGAFLCGLRLVGGLLGGCGVGAGCVGSERVSEVSFMGMWMRMTMTKVASPLTAQFVTGSLENAARHVDGRLDVALSGLLGVLGRSIGLVGCLLRSALGVVRSGAGLVGDLLSC